MNALMVIEIRAMEAQARKAFMQMQRDIMAVNAAAATANKTMSAFGGGNFANRLVKTGSQLQWVGRQLTYNFTLPLGIAGAAATKWALDNEKAFVRVTKVYGDLSMSQQQVKNETEALRKNFAALSSTYGVAQADVINLAADWAAAGASGKALAKSVELTLQTMVLGEMNAADATQSLIAIQAQYGLSTSQLTDTIDLLNMVENQTGTTMGDLIVAMSRAAGTARTSGVDIQHLAAYVAALVPAAGTAANAGNALKTIFSRILSPTQDAANVLALMGHNINDLNWNSLNATQRLDILAHDFEGLSSAQKAAVSSTIASRYQINKFDVLMRDLVNVNGYYRKALDASGNAEANRLQKIKELNQVLQSNPQRLKQLWTVIQNGAADIIGPLIPWFIKLVGSIAKLVNSFTELNPQLQKFIVFGLAILALVGPIARYIGALNVLFGTLGKTLVWVGPAIGAIVRDFIALAKAPFSLIATGVGAVLGVLSSAVKMFISFGTGAVKAVFAVGRAIAGSSILASFASTMGSVGARAAALFAAGFVKVQYYVSAALMAVPGIVSRMWVAVQNVMMRGVFLLNALFTQGVTVMMSTMAALMSGLEGIVVAGWAAIQRATATAMAATAFIIQRGTAALFAGMAALQRTLAAAYAGAVVLTRSVVTTIAVLWANLPGLIWKGMSRLVPLMMAGFSRALPALLTFLRTAGLAIVDALTGPIGIGITIAVTLLAIFWKDIQNFFSDLVSGFRNNASNIAAGFKPLVDFFGKAIQAIVRLFYKLPEGVQKAMMAVVQIVSKAAHAVYELFSYINPFAHHSPSLVETVTWGMAEIKRQFASVGNVGGIFKKAAADLAAFKKVAAGMNKGEWSDQRATVAKVLPADLGNFDRLVKDLKVLNQLAIAQTNAVNAQTAVVERWKAALDKANDALDAQQKILDQDKKKLEDLQSAYDAHQQAIDQYAQTGITGMKEMSDQIFANQMAQKQLQLQILQLQDSGQSVEDLTNKMAGLQGAMEALRGEANDLRASGAGSDVLGPIQDQLDAMQQAYEGLDQQAQNNPMQALQDQLDELQRQGEILDLQNSITYDPLTRQIDDLTSAYKELPFDQIVQGIKDQQAAMATLQPQIDAAQAAYDAQVKVVDQYTAARDKLQDTYDKENKKLQSLQDQYATTAQAIRDIESALNDLSSASRASGAGGGGGGSLSPGAQNFMAGAGADWADVGGNAKLGREGGLGDQSAAIDAMTKGLQDDLAKSLGNFDLIGPIKKGWDKFTGWWKANITPAWDALVGGIGSAFGSVDFSGFTDKFGAVWDWLKGVWDGISNFVSNLAQLFGPQLKNIWDHVGDSAGPAFQKISDAIGPLWDAIKGFVDAVAQYWPYLKVVIGIVVGTVIAIISGLLRAIGNIISPIINWIGDIISAVIGFVTGVIKVFSGILQAASGFWNLIIGLFTGNGDKIKEAWDQIWDGLGKAVSGLWDIIYNTWEAIESTVTGALSVIWGAVAGFVQGIVDFFKWLFDVLVGHSIIPDLVNAIIGWFSQLWTDVTTWVSNLVNSVVTFFSGLYTSVYNWVSKLVGDVVNFFKSFPGKVTTAVGNLLSTLLQAGSDLISGLFNGIKNIWTTVSGWLGSLGTKVINAIGSMIKTIYSLGQDLLQGYFNGVKNVWSNISDWFGDIGGKVKSAIGDLGKTLYNAGVSIISGFWNGIKDKFEDVKTTVSGIGDWIKDHKGPESYDRKLLVPHGGWIMEGLGNGIDKGFQDVQAQVKAMGPALSSTFQANIPVNQLAGDLANATARLNTELAASSTQVVQHVENHTYNFYGNMDFPNITNGDDAESFLRNLGDLAGAQ